MSLTWLRIFHSLHKIIDPTPHYPRVFIKNFECQYILRVFHSFILFLSPKLFILFKRWDSTGSTYAWASDHQYVFFPDHFFGCHGCTHPFLLVRVGKRVVTTAVKRKIYLILHWRAELVKELSKVLYFWIYIWKVSCWIHNFCVFVFFGHCF